MSLQERFDKAAKNVQANAVAIDQKASREEREEVYGLFKQGKGLTYDPSARPNVFSIMARGKHDAWGKYCDVPVDEAQERYIELWEKLKAKYDLQDAPEKAEEK